MTKINLTGNEARNRVIKGAEYLSNSVASTLGPFGQNFLLEKSNKSTNDGYTISAELAPTLEDEFERRGALALHEVASKTNDEAGDATTSSMVLAGAIVKEAVRLLPNDKSLVAKKKPSEISKMIEESKKNVIEKLEASAIPVESEEELIQSARVSVEDEELAQLIGSTQWNIGKDGVIMVEEVLDTKSSIDIVKGIHLDNGMGAPIMINDEQDQSLNIWDTPILLTNYTIGVEELTAIKQSVIDPLVLEGKKVLTIIARAFTADAIKLCQETGQKGFPIFPINAPYTYQGEVMRDLAAVTGAKYYDTEESRLEDLTKEDIGFASKLVARRFDAIVTGTEDGNLEAIATRVAQLQKRLEGSLSDFERNMVEARIAQFKGGFAILKVGAETVFERKYKKDKCDDAVNSVRNALRGGTVKGAGLAFKEISDTLEEDDILKRPLQSIYNQIISSAPEGFQIEEWVKDPVITLKAALINACSISGMFASIGGVVTSKDKKECTHNQE